MKMKTARSLSFNEDFWNDLQLEAKHAGLSLSSYIEKKLSDAPSADDDEYTISSLNNKLLINNNKLLIIKKENKHLISLLSQLYEIEIKKLEEEQKNKLKEKDDFLKEEIKFKEQFEQKIPNKLLKRFKDINWENNQSAFEFIRLIKNENENITTDEIIRYRSIINGDKNEKENNIQ